MIKKALLCFKVLTLGAAAFSQSAASDSSFNRHFALEATPGVSVPLPLSIEGETIDIYTTGAVIDVEGMFNLFPFLNINLGLNYSFNPITEAYHPETGNPLFLSIVSLGPGVGLGWTFGDFFDVRAEARGGGYLGFISRGQTQIAINPFVSGGLGLSFKLLPILSLEADGMYRHHFGLHNDMTVSLGVSFHFGNRRQAGPAKGDFLELYDTEFSIFPVLFKYYDEHPVGETTIKNDSNRPVEDVKVTLFAKQYMDDPKQCCPGFSIRPREEKEIDLLALFNREVLQISEGTKSSCVITIEYTVNGEEYVQEVFRTMDFENRNAITWDDDKKAAAFVTAKDPTVLKFAKNVAGIVKNYAGAKLNRNLLTALGIHQALKLYGMSYVIDPITPYKQLSKQELSVDFLQFPNQTLTFKAGDCDDLSILYCALLEAVGIETAFITIPGHIFMMLSLEMEPEKAKKQFPDTDDFIFYNDKTWLPLEVTALDTDFYEAWQLGAKEWRENSAKNRADIYPVRKAWETYAAVGFEAPPEPINFPDTEPLLVSFTKEVSQIVQQQIYPEVKSLEEQIERTQGDARVINRLGTLYARYGLYDQAEQQFRNALERRDYYPALYNLGNLYFLNQQYEQAADFYRRAAEIKPDNPKIALALSRIYNEMENYDRSAEEFEKLADLDPELAEEYAYLGTVSGDTARASEAGQMKGEMIWESE